MDASRQLKTPRQKARQATEAEVLRIANHLLDTQGQAGISLREIARDLGMVSSALYRYVRNRDELITLLVADAYTSLAETVEASVQHQQGGLQTIGAAMLEWSRRYPNRWALLYGTPLENYSAPAELTTAPGTRVMAMVAKTVINNAPADPAASESGESLSEASRDLLLQGLADLGLTTDLSTAVRALSIWTGLVGMISALRFNHLGPGLETVESELLRAHLAVLCH